MIFIFATSNPNKLKEVKAQLASTHIEVCSLEDIQWTEEIPEDQDTIEGNALQKAKYLYDKTGYNCFAEDTGLCIEALEGRPGVYSARYAGPQRSDEDNMQKVLLELEGVSNRKAHFKTVLCLIIDGQVHSFEGIAEGLILKQKQGEKGFGYDPIFWDETLKCTFAQLTTEQKNQRSHRAKAVRKLVEYLKKL